MGHELHDGLCQELAGVALLLQAMQRKIQTKRPVKKQDVDNIARLVQGALNHAHALSHRLRPVDPSPSGLMAALNSLAANMASTFGISCQFRCPRRVEISDPVLATHLYRIAQEWVTHAAQFAGATQILIALSNGRKGITLKITDNSARRSRGAWAGKIVMEMMRHRAEMIGAGIVIHTRKSGGMRLTCESSNSKGKYENHGQNQNHQLVE